MTDIITFSEIEMQRVDYNEKSRQFIHNAIELALSLGDFQKQLHSRCSPETVVAVTAERIARLINFESSALYLVDEESADIQLTLCAPAEARESLEAELDFLIQEGFVAWAMRERRGITVYSKDGARQVLLHPISTYLRARGLFIGIFPEQMRRLPDASLEILSIILRNAANAIEGLVHAGMLEAKAAELEKSVEEKSRKLVQYEKQLLQARHMETIGALAGGVAHQFNNAMTGLLGNIDLIAMCVDDNSDINRYINRIRPITDRMTNLTSQLLAYAQGGKYVSHVTPLKELLTDTFPVIRRAVPDAVQLHLEVEETEACAKVDMIQIRMVISAIVSNAVEAIEDRGHIFLKGALIAGHDLPATVRDELPDAPHVCITVQDTGKGMDEKTLSRLFEPFFSTKFKGRGLTMAAVFGIIKNHNGWIAASSRPDQGTEVQIYLPVVSPS